MSTASTTLKTPRALFFCPAPNANRARLLAAQGARVALARRAGGGDVPARRAAAAALDLAQPARRGAAARPAAAAAEAAGSEPGASSLPLLRLAPPACSRAGWVLPAQGPQPANQEYRIQTTLSKGWLEKQSGGKMGYAKRTLGDKMKKWDGARRASAASSARLPC